MKKWFENKLPYLVIAAVLLIVIGAIALWITALVMYGGKPITEVPAWALIFLFGNRG